MQYIKKQTGFTLLEMLVVLVIIGLLAALVGPNLWGQGDKAKQETAEVQIKMFKGALLTLYLDIGRYPTDEEGLAILQTPPSDEAIKPFWKGPYLDEAIPLDPWHRPYQYSAQKSAQQPFTLYSFGGDGQPGGIDGGADIGYLPAGLKQQ